MDARQHFLELYAKSGNGTQAWLQSHPKCKSNASAAACASSLLRRLGVTSPELVPPPPPPVPFGLHPGDDELVALLRMHARNQLQPSAAIKAIEILLKLEGRLIERRHVVTTEYTPAQLSALYERDAPAADADALGAVLRPQLPDAAPRAPAGAGGGAPAQDAGGPPAD